MRTVREIREVNNRTVINRLIIQVVNFILSKAPGNHSPGVALLYFLLIRRDPATDKIRFLFAPRHLWGS